VIKDIKGNDREETPVYGIKCGAWMSSVICDYIESVNTLWLYGATNCLFNGIESLVARYAV
jgi:hypothetical protein